jgi:predicted AlkP superfamily phosphohydrolase/phosphomutase
VGGGKSGSGMGGPKVLVIGLDGATWDLIAPWVKEGALPNIERLLNEGVHSELISTLPSSTGPAWTSIFTGKNPGKHGIFDFFDLRSDHLRPVSSQDIRSKTLWQLVSIHLKRVIVINVPVTYPPAKVNGVIVTGLLTPGEEYDFTYPVKLKEELLRSGYMIEPGVNLVRALSLSFTDETISKLIATFNGNAENKAEVAFKLMQRYDWDLLFIVFEGTDRLGHYLWRDESLNALRKHYQKLDLIIGDFLKKIPNNTTIIILSDHGMAPIKKKFYVNNWLMNLELLHVKAGITKIFKYYSLKFVINSAKSLADLHFPVQRLLGSKRVMRRMYQFASPKNIIDRDRTKAEYPTWTSSGIIVNQEALAKKEDYEQLMDYILREFNELRDPETGERILEAFKREDIYSGAYVKKAPDIILDMNPGYDLTNIIALDRKIAKNPLTDVKGSLEVRSAAHTKKGILILQGQNIKKGMKLTNKTVYDITPTILYLLGIPVPSDMDGKVMEDAFKEQVYLPVDKRQTIWK